MKFKAGDRVQILGKTRSCSIGVTEWKIGDHAIIDEIEVRFNGDIILYLKPKSRHRMQFGAFNESDFKLIGIQIL